MTLAEWTDHYWQWRWPTLQPAGRPELARYLNRVRGQLEEFIDRCRDHYRQPGKTVAPATIRRMAADLRQCWDRAVIEGVLASNPWHVIRLRNTPAAASNPVVAADADLVLSPDQLMSLAQDCVDPRPTEDARWGPLKSKPAGAARRIPVPAVIVPALRDDIALLDGQRAFDLVFEHHGKPVDLDRFNRDVWRPARQAMFPTTPTWLRTHPSSLSWHGSAGVTSAMPPAPCGSAPASTSRSASDGPATADSPSSSTSTKD